MSYLANTLLLKNDDFNIYTLLLFISIGFLAGFFFKLNNSSGKKKFLKMEKDAEANQLRIAALKEKLDRLEKENHALGGSGAKD
jgi:hypothetical protein